MRVRLQVGSQVIFRELPYEVVARTARTVTLRGASESAEVEVGLLYLVNSDGFAVVVDRPAAGSFPHGVLWERVPKEQLRRATWRWHHVQEALTGYKNGSAEAARDGEPREDYHPTSGLSLHGKLKIKAKEMKAERPTEKVSVRSLYRWVEAVEDRRVGLIGLCDKRYQTLHRPFKTVAPEYIEVLDDVLAATVDLSTVERAEFQRRVDELVKERYGDDVRPPKRTTFYELFNYRTRQTSAVGEAPSRRGAASRGTPSPVPMKATRSGEILQVDSTVVDIVCLDRRTGRIVRPEFTVAVDAFDRSLRSVTVTPKNTKGVDAAFLLYDAAVPTARAPGSLDGLWNYAGIPRAVAVEMGNPHLKGHEPASLPFGTPSIVVCDHGKIFLSAAFWSACEELGISVFPAPPGRPHYKGIVERFFLKSNSWLWQRLPGYTGRSSSMRGRNLELLAAELVYLDELRELFLEWAITEYQTQPHEGCRLPDAPQYKVSPNALFERSLAETGFIYVAPHPEQLVRLLPFKWRRINHYGVNIDRLRYYAPILDEWRAQKSPYGNGNRYPIHVDPRDLSRVWFQDPDKLTWHALTRLGARHPDVPFSDAGLAWSKRVMVEQGLDPSDPDALSEEIDALIERSLKGGARSDYERRLISRMIEAGSRSREALEVLEDVPGLLTASEGSAGETPQLVALPGGAGGADEGDSTSPSSKEPPPPTDDGPALIEADDDDGLGEDGITDDDWDDIEPLSEMD